MLDDYEVVDRINPNDQMDEQQILLRHWDRILQITSDKIPLKEKRDALKMALLGLTSFHTARNNEEFSTRVEDIFNGSIGDSKEEVRKIFQLMHLLREFEGKKYPKIQSIGYTVTKDEKV